MIHIRKRSARVPVGAAAFAAICACADAPTFPGVTTCAKPVALRVGEVREFSGAESLRCVVIDAADVATEYLFISANATPVQDDLREYLVRATIGAEGARAAATDFEGNTDGVVTDAARLSTDWRQAERSVAIGDSLEAARHARERSLLGNRSLRALGAHTPAVRTEGGNGQAIARAARQAVVGDTLVFRVGDAISGNPCANFASVRAVVKAQGQRATIALDVAAPTGGFSDNDFRALSDEFDAVTYPTMSAWFGVPTDINRDGRISILFTPQVNRITPTGSLGFVGGFFLMGDLLARDIPGEGYRCPASNEQEVLYLLAPDPNGQVNSNRFSIEVARESARGTIAHELQHMINQGVRQSGTSARTLEVDWLNEGLSHFAEEVVGRAVRGYTDTQRLDWTRVLLDLDDYDSFFRQNLLRYRLWLDRPDQSSPVSARAGFELAPRGAAWSLVRFAADHFGGSNPRAFVRALVAGPQVDIANLVARTGSPFEQLLPRFLVASYADDVVSTTGSSHRFISWNMRDVMQSLNGGAYPLRLSGFPANLPTRSLSGSGNFFVVSRGPRAEVATFQMLAPDGSALTFPGARVYLARLR
jgi:hypothetical protein